MIAIRSRSPNIMIPNQIIADHEYPENQLVFPKGKEGKPLPSVFHKLAQNQQ